jgi:hypothetical protein
LLFTIRITTGLRIVSSKCIGKKGKGKRDKRDKHLEKSDFLMAKYQAASN